MSICRSVCPSFVSLHMYNIHTSSCLSLGARNAAIFISLILLQREIFCRRNAGGVGVSCIAVVQDDRLLLPRESYPGRRTYQHTLTRQINTYYTYGFRYVDIQIADRPSTHLHDLSTKVLLFYLGTSLEM